MASDHALREHVRYLLGGGGAHLDFESAIADLPAALRSAQPPGQPHTPWRRLEHMRIAQWDILEFSRNPEHVSPDFPDGYWPAGDAPPDPDAWNHMLAAFRTDRKAMHDLVADPTSDQPDTFSSPEARGFRSAMMHRRPASRADNPDRLPEKKPQKRLFVRCGPGLLPCPREEKHCRL